MVGSCCKWDRANRHCAHRKCARRIKLQPQSTVTPDTCRMFFTFSCCWVERTFCISHTIDGNLVTFREGCQQTFVSFTRFCACVAGENNLRWDESPLRGEFHPEECVRMYLQEGQQTCVSYHRPLSLTETPCAIFVTLLPNFTKSRQNIYLLSHVSSLDIVFFLVVLGDQHVGMPGPYFSLLSSRRAGSDADCVRIDVRRTTREFLTFQIPLLKGDERRLMKSARDS